MKLNQFKTWAALGMGCLLSSSVWALEVNGPLVQGAWVPLKVEPNSTIEFENRRLTADPQGLALIAFSRDAKPKLNLTVTLPNGTKQQHELSVVQRDYLIQRIDGLPSRHVTPDEATLKKIRADGEKAAQARKLDLRMPYFQNGFDWPAEGWITGVYGSQRILNGHARAPHMGLDIASKTGTPIYAPASGQITLAESMELSGNTVFIDHGYGLRSSFMHLEDMLVKEGEVVERGQLVATMGATGRATGPHLHWGMSWFNVRLDPALIFELPRDLIRGDKIVSNQVVFDETQARN
ncbi:MAG: M23 family metallopeptidase [Thiomicrospira sp.]|uniref:M23 family metallopeptidase n=1 Tax=Thiomicrospira sp. TaxID=935 RepID=UPI0019FC461C|nr:M23 family metallopeptidase [Thiomicrospira sp.]MBE0494090.1 M23 family metallopeptidase [Thiomicrospira sp.]